MHARGVHACTLWTISIFSFQLYQEHYRKILSLPPFWAKKSVTEKNRYYRYQWQPCPWTNWQLEHRLSGANKCFNTKYCQNKSQNGYRSTMSKSRYLTCFTQNVFFFTVFFSLTKMILGWVFRVMFGKGQKPKYYRDLFIKSLSVKLSMVDWLGKLPRSFLLIGILVNMAEDTHMIEYSINCSAINTRTLSIFVWANRGIASTCCQRKYFQNQYK